MIKISDYRCLTYGEHSSFFLINLHRERCFSKWTKMTLLTVWIMITTYHKKTILAVMIKQTLIVTMISVVIKVLYSYDNNCQNNT